MQAKELGRRLREVEEHLAELAREIEKNPLALFDQKDQTVFETRDGAGRQPPAPILTEDELIAQGPYVPYDPEHPEKKPPTIPPHTPLLRLLYTVNKTCTPEYLNGWCCMIWIIQTARGKGGDERVASARSTQLISKAPQAVVNAVALQMQDANQTLYQNGKGICMRICEVNVLDARRLYWLPGGKKRTLAQTFKGGKAQAGDGQDNILDEIESIAINGFAEGETVGGAVHSGGAVMSAFLDKLRKPCVHLFIVNDVEDPKRPDTAHRNTAGLGGVCKFGAAKHGKPVMSPAGVVETKAKSTTFAHEIGHALKLPHSNDTSDEARKVNDQATLHDPSNLMLPENGNGSLQQSQLDAMFKFLIENVAPACPK